MTLQVHQYVYIHGSQLSTIGLSDAGLLSFSLVRESVTGMHGSEAAHLLNTTSCTVNDATATAGSSLDVLPRAIAYARPCRRSLQLRWPIGACAAVARTSDLDSTPVRLRLLWLFGYSQVRALTGGVYIHRLPRPEAKTRKGCMQSSCDYINIYSDG